MKAWVPFLLGVGVALAACGNVAGSAPPSAAELMRSPTRLNLAGRSLSLAAQPVLRGSTLTVQAEVGSHNAYMPMNVVDVYMVTQGGVWSAPGRLTPTYCGPACALAEGQGPAAGLLRGEPVQVVVRLQDSAGRDFWLRDGSAAIAVN